MIHHRRQWKFYRNKNCRLAHLPETLWKIHSMNLSDTALIPGLNANLFSVTLAIQNGFQLTAVGPLDSNHGNLYNKLLALVLGRYGVPHAEVNGTE